MAESEVLSESGEAATDELSVLCTNEFGDDSGKHYGNLLNLRDVLQKRSGQYFMIRDWGVDWVDMPSLETIDHNLIDMPFPVMGIGMLFENPLTTGLAEYICFDENPSDHLFPFTPRTRNRYFLKVNFEDGKYILIQPEYRWKQLRKNENPIELRQGSNGYKEGLKGTYKKGVFRPYWFLWPFKLEGAEIGSEPMIECKGKGAKRFAIYAGNDQALSQLNIGEPLPIQELYERVKLKQPKDYQIYSR